MHRSLSNPGATMDIDRILPLGALLLLPLAARGIQGTPPAPLAPDRDVATLIPERVLVFAEAPGLPQLLDRGLDHPFLASMLESDLGQALLAEAEATPAELLAQGNALFGRPLLPALGRITSNGCALAWAYGPAGAWVAVFHGEDAELLDELLTTGYGWLEVKFGIPGALAEPHNRVRGADVWYLGDELKVARRDALLVASNDEGLLRDVLDLAADPEARGLAGREGFADARRPRGGSRLIRGWVDLDRIESTATRLGGGEELLDLRLMNGLPEVQMLLGPGVAALGTAAVATFEIELGDGEIVLSLGGEGVEPAAVLMPSTGGAGPPALPPAPGDFGRALVYRDFAGMFAHRVDLFPPEILPQFSKATSDLALFFGGKDLGEDVLPGISPWIRLVARQPTFDEGAIPEIPLPAAAMLVGIEQAEVRGPELVAAFQTMVGVINLDRAQKGMMPLVMELVSEAGVSITTAHHQTPGPGDGVDIQYNLVPACALVGDVFVVGTHDSLVRDLVRDLQAGGTTRNPGGSLRESLWISGGELARLIEDNLELLVIQNMLDKGHDSQSARDEIGGLLAVVSLFEDLEAEVSLRGEDAIDVRATLRLAAGGSDGGGRAR